MALGSLVAWFKAIETLYKEHDRAILWKDEPACFDDYLAVGLESQPRACSYTRKRPAIAAARVSLHKIDRRWLTS
jgi:hypothetical protein